MAPSKVVRYWGTFIGLAGAGLAVGAGILSLFYVVGLADRVGFNDGALVFDSDSAFANVTLVPLRSWRLGWPDLLRKAGVPSLFYGPYRDPQRPPGVYHLHARLPLWIPAAGCLLLAHWFRRSQGRRGPGRCACGYDLRGNLRGVCPECGRRATPASIAASNGMGDGPPES